MTFDKFTIKAQETVQEAVNLAQRSGQQSIEPVHLLKALMDKARDVTNFIFQKLGVNTQQIEMLLEQEIKHLPRVQGVSRISPTTPTKSSSMPRISRRRWATSL